VRRRDAGPARPRPRRLRGGASKGPIAGPWRPRKQGTPLHPVGEIPKPPLGGNPSAPQTPGIAVQISQRCKERRGSVIENLSASLEMTAHGVRARVHRLDIAWGLTGGDRVRGGDASGVVDVGSR
jgi:hypothetical protein